VVLYPFAWQFKAEKATVIYNVFLFALNSFTRKRNIAKSKDRISDCNKGQTSVAYRSIGMHLLPRFCGKPIYDETF